MDFHYLWLGEALEALEASQAAKRRPTIAAAYSCIGTNGYRVG